MYSGQRLAQITPLSIYTFDCSQTVYVKNRAKGHMYLKKIVRIFHFVAIILVVVKLFVSEPLEFAA